MDQEQDLLDHFAKSFPVQLPNDFLADALFLEAETREIMEQDDKVAETMMVRGLTFESYTI